MSSDLEKTIDSEINGEEHLREQYMTRESSQDGEPTQNPSQENTEMAMQTLSGIRCPKCGAINDADATFCASCGESLHKSICPHCGSEIDPGSDFCEKCHHYIDNDVCSFCGAHLSGDEAYCPECGSPRGGIVCPSCHTLNEFAFCKRCGRPLTEEAKHLVEELQVNPEYIELTKIVGQYEELQNNLPYDSMKDKELDQLSEEFRRHVLTLLAQEDGVEDPVIPITKKHRQTTEELQKQKDLLVLQLTSLFEKMKVPPMESAVSARNYAMACKPVNMRLGWICNYKHAVHSSPCGCAKPQMGGKWIILGSNQKPKDDK